MLEKTKRPTIKGAISTLYGDLSKIRVKLMGLGMTPEEATNTTSYRNFEEKIQVMEILTDSKRLSKVSELTSLIAAIFADNKAGICCSTIHKVKGLESHKVFIIEPKILQAPWAKKDMDIQQERNIDYVACTRAKNELVFVPEEEFTVYNKRD